MEYTNFTNPQQEYTMNVIIIDLIKLYIVSWMFFLE